MAARRVGRAWHTPEGAIAYPVLEV